MWFYDLLISLKTNFFSFILVSFILVSYKVFVGMIFKKIKGFHVQVPDIFDRRGIE